MVHAAALLVAVCGLLVSGPAAAAQEEPPPPDDGATTTTAAQGPAFFGSLQADGEPVEGVVITVRQGDQRIGRDTSDENGDWRVALPGLGTYTIEIDTDTLPEDLELRNERQESREIRVIGGDRRILFGLGDEEARPGRTFADRFGQSLANGVKFGLIIAMCAIGLSLIFGTTGLINFAHGDLVTFGAIVTWYFNTTGPRLHLISAAAVTLAIAGVLGAVLERGLWRPLRERKVGNFQLLVISIGLALVGRHVILLFFGAGRRPFRDYTIQQRLDLWLFDMTPRDLTVILLSVAVLVAVAVALNVTRIGKATRAVADNIDLAESSGIDVRRIIMIVWVMGTGLAALGGVFLGVVTTVEWEMGFKLLLLMFAGVILGGLGTAYGALVGSLVVGIGTELSTLWFSSEIKFMWALAVLVVVLLVRPQGILGLRERVG